MIVIEKFLAEAIDEWYGIHVTFHWSEDFDFDRALSKYGEGEIAREVAHRVTISPEFQAFYAKNPTVVCDTSSIDESPRRVCIPRFTMVRDYDEWRFDQKGGWIGASVR